MTEENNQSDDFLPEYDEQVEEYISSAKLKLLIIFLFLIAVILCALYSLTVYGRDYSFSYVVRMFFGHIMHETYEMYSQDWFADVQIWNSAVPRMLFTIIAGVGLAIAGASMQSCMNNPLADPYTVGVSAGACLGLAFAFLFGFSINSGGFYGITVLAFLFALFPMIAIVILAPKTRSSPSTLILAGVALSYLFNAINTIILVSVDEQTLESVYRWQVGTLTQIHWDQIPFTLAVVSLSSVVICVLSRKLNLLSLGDASASSLGIDPDNLRIICMMAIAFIVGAVVGSAGVIGFVGLVAPHIARILLGSDNRYVIPAAALISTLLMLVSDTLCRMISIYDDIPVGAVLSLIGAPIFMYLILRRKSRVW